MIVLRQGIRTLSRSPQTPPMFLSHRGSLVFHASRAISTAGTQNWFFSADAAKTSGHSSLLSDVTSVYEMVSDTVAPKDWDQYLQLKATSLDLCKNRRDFTAEHLASWHFIYGDDVFKALHLYKYPNGFADIDKTRLAIKGDDKFQKERRAEVQLISRQENEFLKGFSFWPVPEKRTGGNIYDVRSYELIPGSMFDWGNYWAKGIQYRKQVRADLPYAGFFSQIGKLQVVYHIWVYSDLVDRNDCRKRSWNQENWPDIVTNTVPLIKSMKTRILEPLAFSPTQ